ncbi:MAG: efflux RND transporter periplasmic adaptor subunit [Cytophagaceae bacterium]|jgi:membrane fusion protein (multidrug efflux system)|nr:efflux RND transporter periplasmic adaptor subunit [Cytophagaceae bacterium]
MNRTLKRILQIGLVVAILGVVIIPKTGLFSKKEGNIGALVSRRGSLPVSVEILKPGMLENMLSAAGSLLPSEEVNVTTETSGIVESIHFEEGTRVTKGALLVTTNNDELQAQREKSVHQKKLIEEKVERQRVLFEKEAVSRESYDQVMTDLMVIDADIKLLDTRIEKTFIKAPFDGVIGFRSVSPGAYLQPGVSVARLVNISPLRIEFSISERYMSESLIGRRVIFNVAGFDNDFYATIYAVDPTIDIRTRTIVLRADYPNSDFRLLPGTFASIRMVIDRERNAIQIPSEAIIPQLNGERVFVYRNGKAEQVEIETGIRNERRVAVVRGLAAGDTLITSGILQLRPGMAVAINNN